MLIEKVVCLFFTSFFLNNRQAPSLLRINLISFSQHKNKDNKINVKFSMGCIQFNEKLVSRPKLVTFILEELP